LIGLGKLKKNTICFLHPITLAYNLLAYEYNQKKQPVNYF